MVTFSPHLPHFFLSLPFCLTYIVSLCSDLINMAASMSSSSHLVLTSLPGLPQASDASLTHTHKHTHTRSPTSSRSSHRHVRAFRFVSGCHFVTSPQLDGRLNVTQAALQRVATLTRESLSEWQRCRKAKLTRPETATPRSPSSRTLSV